MSVDAASDQREAGRVEPGLILFLLIRLPEVSEVRFGIFYEQPSPRQCAPGRHSGSGQLVLA
jgi:hypothetical protein